MCRRWMLVCCSETLKTKICPTFCPSTLRPHIFDEILIGIYSFTCFGGDSWWKEYINFMDLCLVFALAASLVSWFTPSEHVECVFDKVQHGFRFFTIAEDRFVSNKGSFPPLILLHQFLLHSHFYTSSHLISKLFQNYCRHPPASPSRARLAPFHIVKPSRTSL